MNKKIKKPKMSKMSKLAKEYSKGSRSKAATKAWANYKRKSGSNKEYMMRCYSDPNNDTKPNILLASAIKRAKAYGCWIDDSPEDTQKQLEIYRECHKMNSQPGQKGKWSVDHIMELQFKGPHCSSNLQIMPSSENIKKSMRERKTTRPFDPKMELR